MCRATALGTSPFAPSFLDGHPLLLYIHCMKRFQDMETFTDEDVEAAIVRNEPDELHLVPLIVALASSDRSFAETVCIRLVSHLDGKVRGNAVTSLGHLARRFRILDSALVRPVIERALLDPDEYVRASAKSAVN